MVAGRGGTSHKQWGFFIRRGPLADMHPVGREFGLARVGVWWFTKIIPYFFGALLTGHGWEGEDSAVPPRIGLLRTLQRTPSQTELCENGVCQLKETLWTLLCFLRFHPRASLTTSKMRCARLTNRSKFRGHKIVSTDSGI